MVPVIPEADTLPRVRLLVQNTRSPNIPQFLVVVRVTHRPPQKTSTEEGYIQLQIFVAAFHRLLVYNGLPEGTKESGVPIDPVFFTPT